MFTFAKLHFTHMKNDKVDARLIAKYLSFNLKKVNPIREEEMRDLARLYDKTNMQLTKYKHMFKNQINIIFPELETHFHLSQAKAITSLLIRHPTPEAIAKLSDEEMKAALTADFKRLGHLRSNFIPKIRELAQNSIGIKGYPTDCFVQTIKILKFYEETTEQIQAKMKTAVLSSPYNKLLNEFGYNEISLACIIGEVGDIRRFPNHKKFVCYCGLNVSEKQSGKNQSKNCYITKRGNKLLRHTFYMLVLVHLNYKKQDHIAAFFNNLKAKGKHPKQCVTACARKIAIKAYYDLRRCHDETADACH